MAQTLKQFYLMQHLLELDPFMNRRVLVLGKNTPAHEVARAMSEKQVGSALISDHQGHILGIVTDRDISSQVLGLHYSREVPIHHIMSHDVVSVSPESSLSDVVSLMETNGIRRIPIFLHTRGNHVRCVGMVSLDDLLASRTLSVEEISRIVHSQIPQRRKRRYSTEKIDERREQTVNRFVKTMALHMDRQRGFAEQATTFLLRELVERLTSTTAFDFISQLPRNLQEDLFDLPAEKHRDLSAGSLVEQFRAEFSLNKNDSREIIRGFWLGLSDFIDGGILRRILRNLPKEYELLFVGPHTPEEMMTSKLKSRRIRPRTEASDRP